MNKKLATISARVDKDVKKQFETTCESMGLSVSAALNIFVRKVINEQAIPFDVTLKNAKKSK